MRCKLILPLIAPLLAACSAESREETAAPVVEGSFLTADNRAELEELLKGVGPGASLTLYEGLPHQMFEHELLKSELATKQTIEIRGAPFYERPLDVGEDDAATLARLSLAPKSYELHLASKACGGFHPDYGLRWQDGAEGLELLICLGCQEMLLIHDGKALLADIKNAAFKQLKATLEKYRDQRPPPEY